MVLWYQDQPEMLQIGVFTDFRLEMSAYFSKFCRQNHTRKRITLTSAPGHRFQTLLTVLGGHGPVDWQPFPTQETLSRLSYLLVVTGALLRARSAWWSRWGGEVQVALLRWLVRDER